MPRPKKELETPAEKEQVAKVYNSMAAKSASYQNSQKLFVEKLIPIDASIVHRRIVKIDGKEVPYDFVDCNLVKVEI